MLRSILTVVAAATLVAGCATERSEVRRLRAGVKAPSLMWENERREEEAGRAALTARFNGEYRGQLAARRLASRIARDLAQNADLPGAVTDVGILDSPLIVAYVTNGGYIMLSRGLMTLANSDAEIAAVIGHEMAHLESRHTAPRAVRDRLGALAVAKMRLAAGQADHAELEEAFAFSREQEQQADLRSVDYLAALGYSPAAVGSFFDRFAQSLEIDPAPGTGTAFEALHPAMADRAVAAAAKAEALGVTGRADSDRYLEAIDGMLYGPNPEAGVLKDGAAWLPRHGLVFPSMPGYESETLGGGFVFADKDGDIFGLIAGAANNAPPQLRTYLTQAALDDAMDIGAVDEVERDGLSVLTAALSARAQTPEGEKWIPTRHAEIEAGERRINLIMVGGPASEAALDAGFSNLIKGVRRLTDDERGAFKSRFLRIRTVKPGDSQESLAAQCAFEDRSLERFRLLNGLKPGDALRAGQLIKMVESE